MSYWKYRKYVLIVRANKLEIYITNAVLGSLYGIYICNKYGFGNLGGFGDIEQDLHAGGIYIRYSVP